MELIGKNITYKYPSSKKYVLKDVDITLNSDKITGLIGESGKGKSTLCKILSNYIPKYDGEVYLDNQILPKNGFCPVQLIFQHPEKVMNPKWKMKDILELMDKYIKIYLNMENTFPWKFNESNSKYYKQYKK